MVIRIDPKQAGRFKGLLTGDVLERIKAKKEIGIASVTPKGELQGVMTLSAVDGMEGQVGKNAVAEYFFVAPRYRRQGVFREMLDFLKDYMTQANGVIFQVITPQMDATEQILNEMGFERLDDGNDIVKLPLSAMEYSMLTFPNITSKLESLIPLDELMDEQRKVFLKAFGDDLPSGLKPESMPGEILLDHSFVYLTNKGSYGGFILSSELDDGTLYLGSLFVKPEYKHMAVVLLAALYRAATDPGLGHHFTRIMYATASVEARNMSDHMLEGYEKEAVIEHTHNYYLEFKGGKNG